MEENTPTTITKENTPNLEPHNAPFNRGSVPTATPHKQTTEGQGWSVNDLYKAIISGVVIVGAIGGIITFAYKKGSDIYHACQEYCSKTEEPYPTFAFSVPNVEDTDLMGNGSGDADSSEVPL